VGAEKATVADLLRQEKLNDGGFDDRAWLRAAAKNKLEYVEKALTVAVLLSLARVISHEPHAFLLVSLHFCTF
jgi:hypothetical protein